MGRLAIRAPAGPFIFALRRSVTDHAHPEHPFSATHSLRFFFVTEPLREILRRMDEGLGARAPFLLVTGEAGSGKTALVLEAAARWGSRAHVAWLANPALTRSELVEEIARRFGATPQASASKPQLLALLDTTLAAAAAHGKVPVVVIDDAHLVADELLEELCALANAQALARRAFEIVLAGHPALDSRLGAPGLTGVRQRVSLQCSLPPLTPKETRQLLHHRVGAAGGDGTALFPRKACTEVHARAHGNPRLTCVLAAEALRLARGAGQQAVTPEHVRDAAPAVVRPPASEHGAELRATPAPGAAAARTEHVISAAPTPVVAASPPGAASPTTVADADQPVAPAAAPVAAAPAAAERDAPAAQAPVADAGSTAAVTEPVPSPSHAPAAPPAAAAPAAAAAAEPDAAPSLTIAAVITDSTARRPPLASDAGAAGASSDSRVREWVTRFVGEQGPPRIGSRVEFKAFEDLDVIGSRDPVARGRSILGNRGRTMPAPFEAGGLEPDADADLAPAHVEPDRSNAAADDDALDELYAPRRRTVAARPAPRRRGPGAPAIAAACIGLIAVAAVLAVPNVRQTVQRGIPALHPTWGWAQTPQSTQPSADAPAAGDPQPPTGTESLDARKESAARHVARASDPVSGPQADLAALSDPARARAAVSHDAPPSDTGDERRSNAPVAAGRQHQRLGLEVANYSDASLAATERDRIASESGLKAWLVRNAADGGWRVIAGVFSSPERAQTSADILLERGIVSEARIVHLPPRPAR